MNLTRKLLPIFALACFATPAAADTIALDASKIGQSYTFNYDGFSDGSTISGLTSSTTFTLTGINGNAYNFDYSVSNTSGAPVTGSRLSGFAFNTDPNIQSATSTGAFGFTTLNSNYPNGIGSVDVCFKDANTGSCAGGGSGGLEAGQTGTGSFALNFSQPVSALSLSDFFVRYQSIEGVPGITSASGSGTQTSSSTSSTSTSTGGTPVPEPGVLGTMAGGLAALAMLRRRRTVKKELQPAFA